MGLFDNLDIKSTSAPATPAKSSTAATAGLFAGLDIKPAGSPGSSKPDTGAQPFSAVDKVGNSFGFSDTERDDSGKPFFAFRAPGDKSTTTDKTRVATSFDPRVAQKLDSKTFLNERAVSDRANLKTDMGGAYSDELDHAIALELSGSNDPSNLIIEKGRTDGGTATQHDQLENSLAKDVASGKKSLFDAQTELAKAKGIKLPFTGEDKRSFIDKAVDKIKGAFMTKKASAETTDELPSESTTGGGGLFAGLDIKSSAPSFKVPANPNPIVKDGLGDTAASTEALPNKGTTDLYKNGYDAAKEIVTNPKQTLDLTAKATLEEKKSVASGVLNFLSDLGNTFLNATHVAKSEDKLGVHIDHKPEPGMEPANFAGKIIGGALPYLAGGEIIAPVASALEASGPLTRIFGKVVLNTLLPAAISQTAPLGKDETRTSRFLSGLPSDLSFGITSVIPKQTISALATGLSQLGIGAIKGQPVADNIVNSAILTLFGFAGHGRTDVEALRAHAKEIAEMDIKTPTPEDRAVQHMAEEFSKAPAKDQEGFFTQAKALLQQVVDAYNTTPNKQGGFIQNPLAEEGPKDEEKPEEPAASKDEVDRHSPTLPEEPAKPSPEAKTETPVAEKGSGKESAKDFAARMEKDMGRPVIFTAEEKRQIETGQKAYVMDTKTIKDNVLDKIAEPGVSKKDLQSLVDSSSIGQREKGLISNVLKEYDPETVITRAELAATLREKLPKPPVKRVSPETSERVSLEDRRADLKRREQETQDRLKKEEVERSNLAERIAKARTEERQKTGFLKKLKDTVLPLKSLNSKTQKAVLSWYQDKAKAVEKAQQTWKEMKPMGPQNMEIIHAYEAGKPVKYIEENLDELEKRARDAGLQFGERQDYLPHVYAQDRPTIMQAVRKVLLAKGMTETEIDAYINGGELPKASRLGLKPFFTKERFFPTYSAAEKYGLTPKYPSPAQLIAHYQQSLDNAIANKNLVDNLKSSAQLLGETDKPDSWEPVTTRFSQEQLYGRPELADFLNNLYRNEEDLSLWARAVQVGKKVNAVLWDWTMSAGIPRTTFNSFGFGVGFIKNITTAGGEAVEAGVRLLFGDTIGSKYQLDQAISSLKISWGWVRADSNKASINFFNDHATDLALMAREGISLEGRVGTYKHLSDTIKDTFLGEKGHIKAALRGDQDGKPSKIGAAIVREGARSTVRVIGKTWDKTWNEKMFSSMLNQQTVEVFSGTYTAARRAGMPDEAAAKLAGDTTKKFMGIPDAPSEGRGQTLEDTIGTFIAAPRYRESIIGVLWNAGKGMTTNFGDMSYSKNRGLIVGALATYALYNVLNKKISGQYLYENPPGREFALRIPTKDGAMYFDILPSVATIPRNLAEGGVALVHGDLKSASQKFGVLLSKPFSDTLNILSGKDYFGRPIYDPNDTAIEKAKKSAIYLGVSYNHPFIGEFLRYENGQEPFYQAAARMLELPVKFSSVKSEGYAEMQNLYDANQKLKAEGKTDEADATYDALPDEKRSLYDTIKRQAKAVATVQRKPAIQKIYDHNQDLIRSGDRDQADQIYYNLSQEDQAIYSKIKKADKTRSNKNMVNRTPAAQTAMVITLRIRLEKM